MLRPTLFLCFGLALFLALGPTPSEGIKCFVCGGPEMHHAKAEVELALLEVSGRQAESEEGKKNLAALKESCGTGTEIDCDAVLTSVAAGQKLACGKGTTKSGSVGRACIAQPEEDFGRRNKCKTGGGASLCFCTTDLCNGGGGNSGNGNSVSGNSSPSLRQKKYGPLSALGLALLVAYFGFSLAYLT